MLEGLISRGYFPKELPPPFTTVSYGIWANQIRSALPRAFESTRVSRLATHNLVRSRTLRRCLGIPNPVNFLQLGLLVVDNWPVLAAASSRSQLSLTSPRYSVTGRALSPDTLHERPAHRARTRASARFLLRADIGRFYPSLYTHSIPWALHTKAVAKRDRSPTLLGNALDRVLRDAQDQQTLGVPIGPDTSLLIAEIILGAVDEALSAYGPIIGFRYVDDYELSFPRIADAEAACTRLQEILTEFELGLNPSKTHILELPVPLDGPTSEFRAFLFRAKPASQLADLIRYFDRVLEVSRQVPDENVLKYAISRLKSATVHRDNWSYLQDLLLQCAINEPACLSFCLDELWRYRSYGYPLDTDKISAVLNEIIRQQAPLGHSNQVAWALWGLLVLNQPLAEDTTRMATRLSDSVVALLALHAHRLGLLTDASCFAGYLPYMTTEDLCGSQWLLAYEAGLKGWLPSLGVADHISADPCFSELRAGRVSFYDETIRKEIIDFRSAGPEDVVLFPSGKHRKLGRPAEAYE